MAQYSYEGVDISRVSGLATAAGDNELVAAPGANKRIVITDVTLQSEETGQNSFLAILRGNTVVVERYYSETGMAKQILEKVYEVGARPKLSANQALVLNLSGAYDMGYTVGYFVEPTNTITH